MVSLNIQEDKIKNMEYNVKVNSSYVMLCGLFTYDAKDINVKALKKYYTSWKNRINNGDYESTFHYLKNSYYKNFINSIFPEINEPDQAKRAKLQLLDHYTYKECIENPEVYKNNSIKISNEKNLKFDIDFIDLYLFPHNVGIFSIKLQLCPEFQSIENISDFSNKVRLLFTNVKVKDDNEISLKQFFENHIAESVQLKPDWDYFNPQLKSYIQIDLDGDLNEAEKDCLLFDIGNISPLGTAKGGKTLSPSQSYFDTQMQENKISVFENWSVLSLFDTFTRISYSFSDTYKSWEYEYFNVYIHLLYSKFFLYVTSSRLSDVTIVNKETANNRDEFIEFINDGLHSHVSYKFLPNLLIKKLHYSLAIESEVEKMEVKVMRINEHFQEKREKTLNIAISIIAFLSIFSSLYDFSKWGISVGYPEEFMFPYTSIGIGVSIFLLIFIVLRKNSRINK